MFCGPHRPCVSPTFRFSPYLVSKTAFSSKTNTSNCSPVDPSLLIEDSALVEEETLYGYRPEHYYPVYIGQVFQDRYSVIGKLGYGTASTVWLCHDLQQKDAYVALKVYTNNPAKTQRELPVYQHINNLGTQHGGLFYMRAFLDSFQVTGPDGKHTCLVLEALGMNMEELRDLVPNRRFEPDLVRQSLREILRALHFLHHEAHVVHTGSPPTPLSTNLFANNNVDLNQTSNPKTSSSESSTPPSSPASKTTSAPTLSHENSLPLE